VEDEVKDNLEEAGNADDDEELQQTGDEEPHALDEYPDGPFDVFVITKYQHHVVRHLFDGVVRFYKCSFGPLSIYLVSLWSLN